MSLAPWVEECRAVVVLLWMCILYMQTKEKTSMY